MANLYKVGIDLGGTKMEICVVGAGGNEILRRRTSTPQGDYEGTLKAIRDLVKGAEENLKFAFTSVGIGIPGSASLDTDLIKNANSICLIGKPLKSDLEVRLKKKVYLENDANCFVISESTDGAAQGYPVVFGVILGTGVGGGIVVRGKVLRGRNSIAGEWGHNPLPWPVQSEWPGSQCYCGKMGCIETWISGPGFSQQYLDLTGKKLSPDQIFELKRTGEPSAMIAAQAFLDRLARSLAGVINILDPDCIVIGGGLSNIDEIYTELPDLLSNYVFSDSVKTVVVRNRFGDSSGVRGAAWLNDGELRVGKL